ncbi:C40 family peptidase [Companilactobacillus baiquanensis]|uniref:C40 family peptidase n=1 Tax=Companilactobacillus baiquanensis TaxID=2486005 RepID=A0ABW1UWS1_9LACO|nr:C40 family peptidase [Companilactobacillus baiquanensis]
MNTKIKKSLISFTAAASLAVTGLGMTGLTTHAATQIITDNVPSVVTANKTAMLYKTPSKDGDTTGRAIAANTPWAVGQEAMDDQGNIWYFIGTDAWVQASDVTTNTEATQSADDSATQAATTESAADTVISTAKQYIGTPYVWGGKTPSGFDCSGFTSYVFNEALGKSIGSYTVAQEGAGTQESVSQASAGDLLFWGSKGSTYHVAIYLGNNQYIAAPKPGDSVKVATISSYFMPSFAVKVL